MSLPADFMQDVPKEVARRHTQIQIALVKIGEAFGFQNSIAVEDQHIIYQGRRLLEHDNVIKDLKSKQQLIGYPNAIEVVRRVDVVWFRNGTLMPAAFEVEHSTKIRSGLDRLQRLKDALPPWPIRNVIVADDSDRNLVKQYASEKMYKGLKIKFFPYSAVEELYSLCTRRKIGGVTEEFIDSFMESI
jgi:type II restriction enzyme